MATDPLSNYVPVPEAGCWLWLGGVTNGYGLVKTGPIRLAHRLFWTEHRGQIPDGLCVCHKCDTPLCVNPDHLFLGTNADNMADRKAKGRYKGEWNGRCLLTEEQAIEAISLKGKLYMREIGDRFGVSREAISCLLRGRTWPHLERPKPKDMRCCDWDTFFSSALRACADLRFPAVLLDKRRARRHWRAGLTGYEAVKMQQQAVAKEGEYA